MYTRTNLKWLALAGLLWGCGVAQATITVYTSRSSFLAAVTAAATDTFNDLSPGTAYTGPLARSAGPYNYLASAGSGSPVLYGAGTSDDAALSTNLPTDTITFSGFAPGVSAVGGFFFGSDNNGAFLRRGSITVSATDGSANASQTVNFALQSNFIGFVSNTPLVSVVASSSYRNTTTPVWVAVNNLTLASPVPEPTTHALLLAGVGVLAFLARRRRS
jgi:hypothetical protein